MNKRTIALGLATSMLLSINAGAANCNSGAQNSRRVPTIIVNGTNLKDVLDGLNDRLNQFD